MLQDQITLLRANWTKLQACDHDFAQSLLKAAASAKGLSEKQAYWVGKLCERLTAPKLQAIITCARIFSLLDKASAKLKWPKIRIACEGGKHFILARGMNADKAFLKAPNEQSPFGVLKRSGELTITRGGGHKDFHFEPVLKALELFESDPAEAAKVFGQAFSNCCFCWKELTDAESIKRGYGPICAAHWGLPHAAAGKGIHLELSEDDLLALGEDFELED